MMKIWVLPCKSEKTNGLLPSIKCNHSGYKTDAIDHFPIIKKRHTRVQLHIVVYAEYQIKCVGKKACVWEFVYTFFVGVFTFSLS